MRLVGFPELIEEPWFSSGHERAKRADLLDKCVGDWIAQRDLKEVMEEFTAAQAAVAPIYDISQIMEDPQYRALDSITEVDDPELGRIKMQNMLFRDVGDPRPDPLERAPPGSGQPADLL